MLLWLKRILLTALLLFALAAAYGGYKYYIIFGGGSATFDTQPPVIPDDLKQPAILVFSKTNSYRHDSIPKGNAALSEIAKQNGWGVFVTENAAVFNNEQLALFKVAVWNNASGDVLLPDQKTAFRTYIEQGGGFVGIHAGGDNSHTWDWYAKELISAHFTGHPMKPQIQKATIHVEDRDNPATRHLPPTWERVDEWYSFEASPRERVHVLGTLDEKSYNQEGHWTNRSSLSMGSDHPIIWLRCVKKGRSFYSALGHTEESYSEAPHLKMLENGIAWAAGLVEGQCGT